MKFLFLILIFLVGCTNAQFAQFTSIGNSGHITCYSGGVKIFEDTSTGKIHTESSSDGWYFQSIRTGKLIRVSGTCIIEN